MKLIALLGILMCSVIAVSAKKEKGSTSGSRMVGGLPAKQGDFPYTVGIRYKNGDGRTNFHIGALICERWVLTEAYEIKDARIFSLIFGTVNKSDIFEPGRVVLQTEHIIIHEKLNTKKFHNNVALLRLNKAIDFTDKIKPIPLGQTHVEGNVAVTLSGWGRNSSNTTINPILNYLNLTTITNNKCKERWGDFTVTSTLCTAGSKTVYPCDYFGNPLVTQNKAGNTELVGILNLVGPCTEEGPRGFERVESFIPWIKSKINGTCTLP